MNKDDFICGLNLNSIKDIEKVPKSDLHSHAGRGGTISYIEQWANVKINPPTKAFNSLEEVNGWLNDNVKCYCPGVQGYY